MTRVFMTLIIIIFTVINYGGASETGTVGNIVTLTNHSILGLFVFFGILAMLRTDAWHNRFTTGFMPNGFLGDFAAMGLTFLRQTVLEPTTNQVSSNRGAMKID